MTELLVCPNCNKSIKRPGQHEAAKNLPYQYYCSKKVT